MTPALVAPFSIAAPDTWSRLTMTSALTPLPSICSAIEVMVCGLPLAFLMSQLRLSLVQAALRAAGSAVTQRGDDVVSGRMMPTLAPLPSMAPLAEPAELEDLLDEEEDLLHELLLSELEPQAARDIAAATPSTA